MAQPGYDDTPFLPGSKWRVHDSKRPQPRIITPGIASTQDQAGAPPSDAVVLFGGADLSGWQSVKDQGPAMWKVENGYAEVVPGTGDIESREHFGDCQLHLEFACPSVVKGESQGRGNSGVFLLGRYEIQVLDGYQNPTYADGSTASIYGQYPPLVNACRAPGQWQSYDAVFIAPRFENNKLVSPAFLTLFHNGVLAHHRQEALGPTGHRSLSNYNEPHPSTGPLKLQDHGDLVRYRNVWYRPLTGYDQG